VEADVVAVATGTRVGAVDDLAVILARLLAGVRTHLLVVGGLAVALGRALAVVLLVEGVAAEATEVMMDTVVTIEVGAGLLRLVGTLLTDTAAVVIMAIMVEGLQITTMDLLLLLMGIMATLQTTFLPVRQDMARHLLATDLLEKCVAIAEDVHETKVRLESLC